EHKWRDRDWALAVLLARLVTFEGERLDHRRQRKTGAGRSLALILHTVAPSLVVEGARVELRLQRAQGGVVEPVAQVGRVRTHIHDSWFVCHGVGPPLGSRQQSASRWDLGGAVPPMSAAECRCVSTSVVMAYRRTRRGVAWLLELARATKCKRQNSGPL